MIGQADDTFAGRPGQAQTMRVAIFGAGGPTGRHLVRLTLAAGHEAVAVTRRPDAFAASPGLRVFAGDVLDQDAVHNAVRGTDAVLSALGVPFGKAPVRVYSTGVRHILAAMGRHGARRLVVVTSGAVTGAPEPTGGLLFNRVLQPYVVNRLGRTVYDDMRRLEETVGASEAVWTILRPSGLYELPAVTDYSLTEEHGPGRFTARIDLADAMLRQLDDTRFVRKVGHVITRQDNPSMLSMMLREARRR